MFSFVPPIRDLRASIERSKLAPVTLTGLRVAFRDVHYFPTLSSNRRDMPFGRYRFRLDMFHEQLPLPVPCYDLLPVIEFAVVLNKSRYRAPPTSLS